MEAAGIEPLLLKNTNPTMANDFGFYDMKTFELPRRFESLGDLPSLEDNLETLGPSMPPVSSHDARCDTVPATPLA